MYRKIAQAPRKLLNSVLASNNTRMVMRWATEGVIARNWGDKLNPYLAQAMSGKTVIHRADVYPWPKRPIHYWIGSHLATACADPNAIVWGAGFISYDVPVTGRPRSIHAVRGWLSFERLKQHGIAAPEVVGDAALLLPRIYSPRPTGRRFELGIIPHCFEWNDPFFVAARQWRNVTTIDITGDIEQVVDQICACDRIASSSLHGIICADSYGIPSAWLHSSDKPAGDGFKFRDYFTSVGRSDWDPMRVGAMTTRTAVENAFREYTPRACLDDLWRSCPMTQHTT